MEEVCAALRARHPREWAAVSDARGAAVLPRCVRRRLAQLGATAAEDADSLDLAQRLLARLDAAPSPATSAPPTLPTPSGGRWKILRSAILRHEAPAPDAAGGGGAASSVRREVGLHAFERVARALDPAELGSAPGSEEGSFVWSGSLDLAAARATDEALEAVEYRRGDLLVRTLEPARAVVQLRDLVAHRGDAADASLGVDNTGNVCVWPGEEALALLCLARRDRLAGRSVVELGAGRSGLAGWVVAQATEAAAVCITDGNARAARSLVRTLAWRDWRGPSALTVGCLPWTTEGEARLREPWATRAEDASDASDASDVVVADVVVGADILFFEDFHAHLLHTSARLMRGRPEAEAWFVAPSRGGSLERFAERARNFEVCVVAPEEAARESRLRFDVVVSEGANWDPVVEACVEAATGHAGFDADLHTLRLVQLRWATTA